MKNNDERDCVKNGGSEWTPTGGVVLRIEFDKRLLNELRALADEDGVKTVYQMIRNACWQYAEQRRAEKGQAGGILGLFKKRRAQ